ncbi:bifunctional DnaQ family exonuclease/ATP-dependent helicase [Streptococcus caprae]
MEIGTKQQRYAIVDLEATSASADAAIIQVGIVIVENQTIIERYETDVNPYQPLDDHIINLTGLTDQRLANAPGFEQVAGDIYELIKDCIFVAHNVKFDANLLAEQLFFEGYELRTPRVDTVELAQVFFPTLEKYNLSDLSEALDLDLSDAHTAIADAQATALLLIKLQEKMRALPRLVLENILTYSDSLLFESALVIREALAEASLDMAAYDELAGLVVRKWQSYGTERRLSQDFATNLALLELEERPKQMIFAQAIAEHYADPRPVFMEGQAGLGKTYGYLLPLLEADPDRKLILCLPTKILQDQVYQQEAAKIGEIFHINAVNLKGPQNYISLDKFYETLQREDSNRLINRYKMQLLVWLTETETGDLSEIKQQQRYQAYFEEIKHNGDIRETALFYDLDFVKRLQDKVQTSRLIITNQAYFLTRVEDDKAFAEGHILVIDEAQKFFLALEQFSRRTLNLTETLQALEKRIGSGELALLERRLMESLSFELSQAAEAYYQGQGETLSELTLAKIRQDLRELESQDVSDLAELFLPTYTDFWFSQHYDRMREMRQTDLHAARLDFLHFPDFLPETTKTYFISATLTISDQVALPHLLGYQDYLASYLPIDKPHNQKVWLLPEMPDVSQIEDEDYAHIMAGKIAELTELAVPIVILTTSRRALFALSDALDNYHLKHLCQDKNGTASQVKKRFERGDSSILLGTGGFWEGVDFAKQDKQLLVITRLPFDNPSDHFIKKLTEKLRFEGKTFFKDYELPMTTLRLKQAIARTNRHARQKSAVLLMDSRIVHKSYSSAIQEALEQQYPIEVKDFESSLGAIRTFFETD